MRCSRRRTGRCSSHHLIWHGRRVCHARNPACGACPVARWCPAYGEGPTDPVKAADAGPHRGPRVSGSRPAVLRRRALLLGVSLLRLLGRTPSRSRPAGRRRSTLRATSTSTPRRCGGEDRRRASSRVPPRPGQAPARRRCPSVTLPCLGGGPTVRPGSAARARWSSTCGRSGAGRAARSCRCSQRLHDAGGDEAAACSASTTTTPSPARRHRARRRVRRDLPAAGRPGRPCSKPGAPDPRPARQSCSSTPTARVAHVEFAVIRVLRRSSPAWSSSTSVSPVGRCWVGSTPCPEPLCPTPSSPPCRLAGAPRRRGALTITADELTRLRAARGRRDPRAARC